ncbi:hypothetical protein DYBT9623_01362 [Dyadobacter sp. CECT 9623]|uniref:Uncharacterized protein n=1 Tax=Dyadobacter linearis TaxID=2823330 RepID=A0ABN7R8B7_9BACT|nr:MULTISPECIES: hypothetical protein [unclassified Dyadobacter]MCE7059870.1 hypothetical protein [Dyadobacter sp. CY343]CAG5068630.1 hypothetical protein DYBT9623_01362 [Dyadobacter sp. CECT 9623]
MKNEEESFQKLSERIVAGVKKAVDKMLVESAARNETVVIEDQEGKIRHVPAKDLLKHA